MDNRTIHVTGGNYNENIQGNNIQVQGNYIQDSFIHASQDLSQTIAHIEHRLQQLKSEGYTVNSAERKVATEIMKEAKLNPTFRQHLISLRKFVSNAAVTGLIGESAISVVKIASGILGIPIG